MEKQFTPRSDDEMLQATATLERPSLDPERTALVVVDMINHQVTRGKGMLGSMEESGANVDYIVDQVNNVVIPNLQKLLSVCRKHNVMVVYLKAGCYSPDMSDAIPAFRAIWKSWNAVEGAWPMQVIDPIKPQKGDISLVKSGTGGFYTSPLDSILRNSAIQHVLYTGVVTNACVLATALGGFDRGYYGYLISDGCATFSERLKIFTEEIISAYIAQVVSTDEIIKKIKIK